MHVLSAARRRGQTAGWAPPQRELRQRMNAASAQSNSTKAPAKHCPYRTSGWLCPLWDEGWYRQWAHGHFGYVAQPDHGHFWACSANESRPSNPLQLTLTDAGRRQQGGERVVRVMVCVERCPPESADEGVARAGKDTSRSTS
eukprot:363754-Chlamydomonas_euryale.AAC.5